ncbi:MFS transporter [Tropicimonas sp.]|uniref:MFS transporter n=1 Tax=Tropicimonas sp. TaxID=2067044 RepID=UPI003A8B541C
MLQVISATWALMFGLLLLMVGNGVQGTLLGIRGGIESFTTYQMSVVMSAYFLGFLGGSRLAPEMIRRVGHIRVFAALGSLVSAILILYPTFPNPVAWSIGRVLMGFCLSGVYVTTESWLNNAVTNERRGQALSLYMIVQMAGIMAAQGLLLLGDPAGYLLFVIPSVLVSVSFAPILLAVSPTPAFEATKLMSLRRLWRTSPLGCVGTFLLGGVYSATFGMASVFGTEAGLGVAQISAFVFTIYLGGMLMQYPIGWLSDRMDRRWLILVVALVGALASVGAFVFAQRFEALLIAAFLIGGSSNPLYALVLAYVNDHLKSEDMAAASGGLIFINGIGAIAGPLITGWMMEMAGPQGFFLYLFILCATLTAYAGWRMTRSGAVPVEDTASYAPVLPTATPVAVAAAHEVFSDPVVESGTARETHDRGRQETAPDAGD